MDFRGIVLYSLTFALSILLAVRGTPLARQAAIKFGIVDRPDGNLKSQKEPVPYLGGLAIYMSFLLSLALTFEFSKELLGITLGGTIIVLLGLIDDFGVLTPEVKFLGQGLAAFVLIKSGTMIYLSFIPFWLRVFLTVLWVIAITNAFNIIDVMDGLSAGVGVVAAITLSVVAMMNGKITMAIMAAALAGSALGFLKYNFNPARIYMGDTGSMFLGFTLAALSIGNSIGSYTRSNFFGFLAPILIMGVPIFDTVFVMFIRWRRGIPVMRGSPDHFALRLRKWRLTTRQTVWTSYLATAVLGGVGIAMMLVEARTALIILGATLLAGVALGF